ncbi:Peptidyl-prolyl cis-trans isomerase cyp18 [Phycisphaerales bacterium]|nr:Peptidyl-prolyl cis-trans isomerase cyp18 [Phycisphaerales bacterium]
MRTPTRLLIAGFTLASISLGAFAQPAKPTEKPKEPAQPAQPAKQPDEKPPAPAVEALVYVTFKTSAGDIVLELNQEKAPLTVKNFLSYVDKGHYNGTVFHRVIANFMIQGGGFGTDGKQKPTDPGVKNEWQNGLKNVRGSISMARIGGQPDSGTSQFFINVENNANLDQKQSDGAAYAVFGRVVDGMDTVEAIRRAKVGPDARGEMSKPASPVEVKEAKRLTPDEISKLREKLSPSTPAPDKK